MRSSLLLAVLPIACTVSSAAPHEAKPEAAKKPQIATATTGPIIEKGEGCYEEQEIAADRAKGGRPSKHARVVREDSDDFGADAGEGAAVGRGSTAARRPAGAPPPPPSPSPATTTVAPGRPAPRPPMQQPSGVRAGEWDDNANYRDYVKWLAASSTKGKLAIGNRQFLVVSDKDGKAVPNCAITVKAGQQTAQLVSMSSGRALLFPEAFGMTGTATATASCNGATATAQLDTRAVDGIAKLTLDAPRALPAKRQVDLAFVLDTTGSMAEEIEAVKQTISAVSGQLSSSQTDVRIALVEYKDRSDCLLTRTFPFSSDLTAFAKSIEGVRADGGGDMPEDMHKGVNAALDKLAWRATAATRMIVVIADAPPQFYPQSPDYADSAKRAAAKGIKLYTVAASGMDELGQVVMRQMAQFTGASNMFVLRGGAGPQSVGGGDPKSSCGGTHQDFSSGKLDQLILRKLRGELAALDANPLAIPGRGQDENAKPCDQRLVVAN